MNHSKASLTKASLTKASLTKAPLTKVLTISLISFILLDYLWSGIIYKAKYTEIITKIQAVDLEFRYSSSLMVYFMMSIAIVVWVIPKIDEIPDKTDMEILKSSMKYGSLMGLMIYGFYNFSNYAIFRHWSLETGLVDILWGSFLTGIVSYIVYAMTN
jgi:uncharacterized membrane protein